MPATTTCRAYPYPIDTDPIDVAGDIRKLAEAVDADTCSLVANELIDSGYAQQPSILTNNGTGWRDVLTVLVPPVPFDCIVTVNGWTGTSSDSVTIVFGCDLITDSGMLSLSTALQTGTDTGIWAPMSHSIEYAVAANASCNYKHRMNMITLGVIGGLYVACESTWQRRRA